MCLMRELNLYCALLFLICLFFDKIIHSNIINLGLKCLGKRSESRYVSLQSERICSTIEIASLLFVSLESQQNVMHERNFIASISLMRKDEEELSLCIFTNLLKIIL